MGRYTLQLLLLPLIASYLLVNVQTQEALQNFEIKINGYAGNGIIYYGTQSNDGLFSITNPQNPCNVKVQFNEVISGSASTANVCINTNQLGAPISGVNLPTTCPSGGFTVFTNDTTTQMISKLKFNRKLNNRSMALQNELSQQLASENNDLTVNLAPSKGDSSAFIVELPGVSEVIPFTLTLTGSHCSDPDLYPILGNCIPITQITSNNTLEVNIPANSWSYYKIVVPAYSSSPINLLNVTYDNTQSNYSVYIQQNYLPSSDWHLPLTPTTFSSSSQSLLVYSPAYLNDSQTYFLAIHNQDQKNAYIANISISFDLCENSNTIGPNCAVDSTSTVSDGSGVIALNVLDAISLDNYINAKSFDFSSNSADQLAYFQITNLPDYPTPYYLRVSVGNNDVSANEGIAPALYSKFGGYPSAQSFDSVASENVVNQAFLPIYDINSTSSWYVAVQLPFDFSIWVGTNCANNCSNDGANECLCSSGNTTVSCQSLTNYGANPQSMFVLPSTSGDSVGVCTCADDSSAYTNSYDCHRNPPWILYIIVGVILVVLTIGVAIGVPIFVYYNNKKRGEYTRV